MTHPEDDDGDALRRLEADGDDLTRPRDIDFSVVIPDELNAEAFAAHFRKAGYKVSVEHADAPEGPSDVTITKHMIPSHTAIIDFEQTLQRVADPLNGYNDGWGCFAQPKHIV